MRFLSHCAAALTACSTLTSGQLHFASLGNWGSGTNIQISVAKTLKQKAKEQKISFLVSPGSNFIRNGVTNLEDKSWDSNFKIPYQGPELYLPFFTVLGLDDWQGNHSALALKSVEEYAAPKMDEKAPKWTLPNWWYHYGLHFQDTTSRSPVQTASDSSLALVFVDTFILSDGFVFPNITQLHWDALKETIEAAVQVFDWIVIVGDKALMSSGSSRGNVPLKRTLGAFLKEHKVDAYISGNDKDMEIIKDDDLIHINCGSGSQSVARSSKTRGSIFYAAKVGFCHHIVTSQHLTTELIDGHTGAVLFSYEQERVARPRSWLSRFQLYKEIPEVKFVPIPPFEGAGGMRGPGGRFIRPPGERDWFVRLFGTLGLLVAGYVTVFGIAGFISKSVK